MRWPCLLRRGNRQPEDRPRHATWHGAVPVDPVGSTRCVPSSQSVGVGWRAGAWQGRSKRPRRHVEGGSRPRTLSGTRVSATTPRAGPTKRPTLPATARIALRHSHCSAGRVVRARQRAWPKGDNGFDHAAQHHPVRTKPADSEGFSARLQLEKADVRDRAWSPGVLLTNWCSPMNGFAGPQPAGQPATACTSTAPSDGLDLRIGIAAAAQARRAVVSERSPSPFGSGGSLDGQPRDAVLGFSGCAGSHCSLPSAVFRARAGETRDSRSVDSR